jgi:hypothetical protein
VTRHSWLIYDTSLLTDTGRRRHLNAAAPRLRGVDQRCRFVAFTRNPGESPRCMEPSLVADLVYCYATLGSVGDGALYAPHMDCVRVYVHLWPI